MRPKQRRRGTPEGVIAAGPELTRAAGSGSTNTSINPLAQRAWRAAVTRNTPGWRRLGDVAADQIEALAKAFASPRRP
jgi:hypothetical protein